MVKVIAEISCNLEMGLNNGEGKARYLVAVNGGGIAGGNLNTNAVTIGEREQFEFEVKNDTSSDLGAKIKTCNETYIKVKTYENPDYINSKPIHCDAVNPNIWEQYKLCFLDNDKFAIKTHNGHYLSLSKEVVEDQYIACVKCHEEGTNFSTVLFNEGKDQKIPEIKNESYSLITTNDFYTQNFVEEYVKVFKEDKTPDIFPKGNIKAGWREGEITSINFEYNYKEKNFWKKTEGEEVENCGQVNGDICQIEVLYSTEKFFCFHFFDALGNRVGDMNISKGSSGGVTYRKKFTCDSGYALVGMVPRQVFTHDDVVTEFEFIFRSKNENSTNKTFNVEREKTKEFMSLKVKNGDDDTELLLLQETKFDSENCPSEKPVEVRRWFINNLTVGTQGECKLYGGLTIGEDNTYFPEDTLLQVIGKDNEFFEFELSLDHYVLNYGESIFYFADDKPENTTFTFMLNAERGSTFFFEAQCITDTFHETIEKEFYNSKTDDHAVFPYFKRPCFKIAAVLEDEKKGEKPKGKKAFSLVGGITACIASTFVMPGSAALLATYCLLGGVGVVVAVGICVYVYNKTGNGTKLITSVNEKKSLDVLISSLNNKKKKYEAVLSEYSREAKVKPSKRAGPVIDLEGDYKYHTIDIAVLIFKQIKQENTEYTIGKECLKGIRDSLSEFANYIGKVTSGGVFFNIKVEEIEEKIDISLSKQETHWSFFSLQYEKIQHIIKTKASVLKYPHLFAIHPGDFPNAGLTIRRIDNDQSYITISAREGDKNLGEEYLCNLYVHEFLHVMHSIENLLDIPFPDPDCSAGDVQKGWVKKYGEKDCKKNNYMAYYDDILKAAVPYIKPGQTTSTYAGVFREMWSMQPGIRKIGVFRIKHADSVGKCLAANIVDRKIIESNIGNDESQYWTITYFHNNTVRIAAYQEPSLYWDVENARPDGEIRLCYFQSEKKWEVAQLFSIESNGDGSGKFISKVTDKNKRLCIGKETKIKLMEEITGSEQKWVFEKVNPI